MQYNIFKKNLIKLVWKFLKNLKIAYFAFSKVLTPFKQN